MKVRRLARVTIKGIVGAVAIAALQVSASAEPAEDGIVVEAPRSLPVPVERSPYSGAPVATTTVKIFVLFGDLDLSSETDAARLMVRIDRVAHDACKYLDLLYPLNPDPNCVGSAVVKARAIAKAEITGATRQR